MTVAIALAGSGLLMSACATKRFVRSAVGEPQAMAEPLAAQVETLEEQARRAPASAPAAAAPEVIEEVVPTGGSPRIAEAETGRVPASARARVRQARSVPVPAAPTGGLPADAIGGVLGAAYELFKGQVGVSAPERMIVGQTGTVMLTVSAKRAAEELRQALDRAAGTDGVRTVQAVRLSRTMSARLTGADFEIVTAPNSEVQTGIDLDDDTTWQWQVRPRRAAPVLQLTVTLTAILQVDGTDRTRDERVFTHNIAVDALPPSWSDRASALWTQYKPTSDFLWGTAFAGLLPVVVRLVAPWRRRRKGSGQRVAPSSSR